MPALVFTVPVHYMPFLLYSAQQCCTAKNEILNRIMHHTLMAKDLFFFLLLLIVSLWKDLLWSLNSGKLNKETLAGKDFPSCKIRSFYDHQLHWCIMEQSQAGLRAAWFTHILSPYLIVTLISLKSMGMLLFFPKIPTSHLGLKEHEPSLSCCHSRITAGVSPQISLPIPEKDILKTNVIHFQICLKSFLFKPQLEVYGLWHKTLITESDFCKRPWPWMASGSYIAMARCQDVLRWIGNRCMQVLPKFSDPRLGLHLKI